MKYWCGRDKEGAKSFAEAEIEEVSASETVIRFSGERKSVRIFDPEVEHLGNLLVIKGRENTAEGWRWITMCALPREMTP